MPDHVVELEADTVAETRRPCGCAAVLARPRAIVRGDLVTDLALAYVPCELHRDRVDDVRARYAEVSGEPRFDALGKVERLAAVISEVTE